MSQIRWTAYAETLFFLSILLFLHGYLFSNFISALAGTSILIFLVYSKLSFQRELGDIQVNRSILENLLYVNHPFHVKTIINHIGGRIHIKATDEIPQSAKLLKGSNTISKVVQMDEPITLSYQLKFTSRGNHRFTTISYDISDLCYLFTAYQTKAVQTNVNVHSDPAELKKAKASYTKEDTLAIPSLVGSEVTREFEGIRQYLPGDLLRDIDWKASSRLQTLFTKTFQKKETLETILLLECTRSMRRTTGDHSKLEHAMAVGIQLTHMLQSMHHKVGFVAYDEHKIISQINPSFDYHQIYKELSRLPTTIVVPSYAPPAMPDSDTDTKTVTLEEPLENRQFLSTISPFLSGGKRQIKHHLQATGIYQAMASFLNGAKQKHLVIITDLETNRNSLYAALNIAHAQHNKIWLLALFTPYYRFDSERLSTEMLEGLYEFQMSREKLIRKLQKRNIEIVELTPTIQAPHIMETIRRKTP